ncbi:energy transducer TonB [Shewanella sp. WXL01]|uniref:energy transducer TonB n=1 Tax=Shewanella sp. WXL01 TaxID=2709721 RepID=UPI0014383817|nr:energy transducer TonB [Shewanella sp. WXL01]NKF50451.1 energy transducer TonB [Shewanella sp. WXL01]
MNRSVLGLLALLTFFTSSALAADDCPTHQRKSKILSSTTQQKITRAIDLQRNHRVEEAINALQSIDTKHDFEKAAIGYYLGTMLTKLGKDEQAIIQFTDAINLNALDGKMHASALKTSGDLLAKTHQHEDAVTAYNEWKSFTCTDTAIEVDSQLAKSHAELEQWSLTLLYARKVLSIAPSNARMKLLNKKAEMMISNISPQVLDTINALDAAQNQHSHLKSIYRAEPVYPISAARQGIEGWVTMSFNVNTSGNVENVVVIEQDESGLFEQSAIEALKKWRYRPKHINGNPVASKDLTVELAFTIKAQ